MGKSPGKWIKTLLFGKKASRGRDGSKKAANEKERWIMEKESASETLVISHPFPVTTARDGQNSDLDIWVTSGLSCDGGFSLPINQGEEMPEGTVGSGASTNPEKSREEQAAIKAQAAFRGYLARRAFRALRGIIRLQALVRGHLVRRQAVATLRCLKAIIRLQAVIRGRRARVSDIGITVNTKFSQGKDAKILNRSVVSTTQTEKLLANAFACKILASSTVSMPLRIIYSQEEPNSAWNWLERWTYTRLWNPPSKPKKSLDSKSRTKHGASHASETEPGRPKRVARRNPTVSSESGLTHLPSEPDKAKRYSRKVSSFPVDPLQENPQNELDKVKRSLRKVSSITSEAFSNRPEADIEKPKRSMRKDQGDGDATEKTKKEAAEVLSNQSGIKMDATPSQPDIKTGASPSQPDIKIEASPSQPDIETGLKPLLTDGSLENLNNDRLELELPQQESSGKDTKISVTNGESISKEDQTCNENQKIRRRASFPVKSEYAENGLQSSPTLPSYMMATESAKAKLRAQGSPRFGSDGVGKNGFTRRHSLPSAANGKVSSLSPRSQRLVQAAGKAGIRNDRSLLSSRDANGEYPFLYLCLSHMHAPTIVSTRSLEQSSMLMHVISDIQRICLKLLHLCSSLSTAILGKVAAACRYRWKMQK